MDLTAELEKPATYEEICAEIRRATQEEMKDSLGYTDEPLVSTDFLGITVGGVFDAFAGLSVDEHFAKLFAWYDNEYSYTCQMCRVVKYICKKFI